MACVSDRLRVAVEIGIIFAVAAAVEFAPGGSDALEAVYAAIIAAFGIGVYLVCVRQYREHRMALYTLGDSRRALFHGATAVLLVTVIAQPRMWDEGGSAGEFAWFVIVGLCIYSYVAIYRFARRY